MDEAEKKRMTVRELHWERFLKHRRSSMWLQWRSDWTAGDSYGAPLCPFCSRPMVRVELADEMKKFLGPHFVCPESGFVFFGDDEGLDVCRHVEQDIRISKGENENGDTARICWPQY